MSQPTAMITFTIRRGEFGTYVSDYHQRKIIEIFEQTDKEQAGTLSFEQIEELRFAEKFKANQEQIEESKKFLDNQKEPKLDLPTFIKYASILVHPLLRDKVFKSILSDEFGVAENEPKMTATANA